MFHGKDEACRSEMAGDWQEPLGSAIPGHPNLTDRMYYGLERLAHLHLMRYPGRVHSAEEAHIVYVPAYFTGVCPCLCSQQLCSGSITANAVRTLEVVDV